MEPSVEVDLDMHDEATSPIPNPVFPPASQLRRASFSDLDASSRVNPNRARRSSDSNSINVVDMTVRTIELGVFREETPEAPSRGRSVSEEAAHRGGHHPRAAQRVQRNGENAPVGVRRSAPRAQVDALGVYEMMKAEWVEERDEEEEDDVVESAETVVRRRVRATSAVLTNIVAGSLSGVALRRVSASALANLTAGLLVTQLLCFMGYAKVEWGALFSDVASLLFQGSPPPTSEEEAQNRLRALWMRLARTLTATVPRRVSFWAGVAGGALLL